MFNIQTPTELAGANNIPKSVRRQIRVLSPVAAPLRRMVWLFLKTRASYLNASREVKRIEAIARGTDPNEKFFLKKNGDSILRLSGFSEGKSCWNSSQCIIIIIEERTICKLQLILVPQRRSEYKFYSCSTQVLYSVPPSPG